MGTGCIDSNCGAGHYIQNYYDGDTIIDGLLYKKINETTGGYSGGCSCFPPEDLGPGYLRDDTAARMVYWRQPGMASDTLLYDFTMELGDTLHGLYGNTGLCSTAVLTVQSIDSILMGGSYRRRINFSPDPCTPTSIIEGMGSTTGLTSCHVTPAELGITLVCFTVDGELLYTTPCGSPDLIACSETLGIPAANSTTKPDALVTPNPSTGLFTIGAAAKTYAISVFTSTGELVWQGQGNTIDLRVQQPGVYTAVVVSERYRQMERLMVIR